MEKSKKKVLSNIFIVLCILIVVGCIGYIVWYFVGQKNQKDVYDNLASEAHVTEQVIMEPTEEQQLVIPIDFAALQQQNPDIYAWISIPGMDIEYPVCQSATDDDYYANHTVDGTEGLPGAIYTESVNLKDFTDFNTVIYGHEMKNGTMFGTLKQYRDTTFMNEHSKILIYTPDSILTYEVFAAVTYSDRHILKNDDFTDMDERQTYLDSIYDIRDLNSPIREDVQVDINSRLLTLCTCIASQPNNRLLIEAVLVDEQK